MNNLDFLDKFINPPKKEYEQPLFLKSNFLDPVWTIEYSNNKTSIIDFNIKMGDDLFLTDIKHEKTLNTLKYWIVFHTINNKNETKSKSIMSESIFAIITIFDALNILNKDIDFAKYGFEALTDNHIKYILDLIANNSDKFVSVYQIKERVIKSFLNQSNVSFLGNNLYEHIEDWNLFENYYKNLSLKELYPDTILKPVKKVSIKSISVDKIRTTQEYENILNDDKSDEEVNLRSFLSIRVYKNVLLSLKNIHKYIHKFEFKVSFPSKHVLENIEKFETNYKSEGRFKTIPSNIVFSYIRKAIEFHYKYGNDIAESYNSFYNKLEKINYDFNKFNSTEGIDNLFLESLSDNLKQLGVQQIKPSNNKIFDGKERFNILRENKYFFDLIKVYYGAVQIVLGALMARRQSELSSLKVGECIDTNSASLIFKQSKSTKGIFGTKNTLYLPIDKIGIEMIQNIEKIHMNKKGEILFCLPQIKNFFKFNTSITNTSYSENIDFFIDYIEGDIVDGKRYYIRQHQLRRFFAMCFFWGSGFGSLDTLRWFMGHTNVEHVYHYITESTSGDILRNVKTQFLLENVQKYENLLSLIKNRYNTTKFDLIDSEDLEDYISALLENDKIIVEPEFLENNNAQEYKIIVKIKGE